MSNDMIAFEAEMRRLRGAYIFDIAPAIEMYRALLTRVEVLDVAFANSHQLNESLGDENRALLARVEAAEALATDADRGAEDTLLALKHFRARVAELESALGGLGALAPDYELPDGAAVAMAIGNGQILTAGRHAIHSAVMSVIDSNRDNEALRARVAELEAQLAAQQWQPVTEEPIEDEYYLTYDALLPGNEPWIVNYYSRTQGWANCCSAWLCPPPKPPRPTGDGVTPSK